MSRKIEFIESSHTYLIDGKIVPSTTRLVGMILGNSYDSVNAEVLRRASDYGTKVHDEISKHLGNPQETPIFETIEARNVIKFILPRYEITPLSSESVVVYENEKGQTMIGTLDLFYGRFDFDNKKTIRGLCDFKTTSKYMEEYVETQLNFYLLAFEQQNGIEINELSCIHIKGATRKFRSVKIDRKKYKALLDNALGVFYGNSN